jgi:hypothetical protein
MYGDYVVRVLTDASYDAALAIGVRGDAGAVVLEEKAA